MKRSPLLFVKLAALATVALLATPMDWSAHAAGYPERPVRIVVPYPPAGGPDILGRLTGEQVAKDLGQPVLIENRGGAGGNIGAQAVANSPADGYTVLMCAFGCGVAQLMYTPMPFDITKDFDPVIMVGTIPSVLVINPTVPAKTVGELVAYAKANPGKLSAASSGIGSSGHLASELFKIRSGVDIVHVPYKGAGQVAADLIGGQVHMLFDQLPSSLASIQSGKLRALAVASKKRSAVLPGVPTFGEAGVADFLITPWIGVLAPAGTPKDVLDRLNQAFNKALKAPAVEQRMKQLGVDVVGGTRESLGSFIAENLGHWATVIKQNNIKAE
jgi:tripartite-type tricarboxylate transporter receptor subunit TctC